MVYKPKKTVNGHKRNDRDTRRRKRVKARRERAARKPVRSNIKRYVAEQLDKIAPDNRYYNKITPEASSLIVPTRALHDFKRIYPFGRAFAAKFIDMEFRRMKPVVQQAGGTYATLGAMHLQHNTLPTVSDNKRGNYNSWRSVLGRGLHMKSSSVYGTITLFPSLVNISEDVVNQVRHADLTLHMFVLEDKAVSKTEFLNWYKDLFDNESTGGHNLAEYPRLSPDDVDPNNDTITVPYCAGSAYPSNKAVTVTVNGTITKPNGEPRNESQVPSAARFVAAVGDGGTAAIDAVMADPNANPPVLAQPAVPAQLPKATTDGNEEFLIDWRNFYDFDVPHGSDTSKVIREENGILNPQDEVFEHLVPCTTAWDGSMDKANLPINKSRFIVHEHKKWKFRPDSSGNIRRCINWEYSFPEHYMHFEKELLDTAYWYKPNNDYADKTGLKPDYMLSRKQPFIVFLYTNCNNEHPTLVPADFVENTTVNPQVEIPEPFKIDMNFKCHYENPLATRTVPTINKGRPLIHKAGPSKKARVPKRRAPFGPVSLKKYTQPTMKDIWKVRRDAGTSSSKALSAQREAAIQKGKEMRLAMRRQEAKDKLRAVFELHGHTTGSFNKAVKSIFTKSTDKNVWLENMGLGVVGRFDGHTAVESGGLNMLWTFLTPEVRKYMGEVLYDNNQPSTHEAIKAAGKALMKYYREKHPKSDKAPYGRHTRLPEYIRRY